jgi:hypothetical protein
VVVLSPSYLIVPPSLVGISSGGEVTKAYFRRGRTSNEVIALCKEIDADLLVVGSRRLGTVRRIVMGSQSEEISSDMHPTRRTRIPPKGLQSPLEAQAPRRDTEANKGSICRYNMLHTFSMPLLFERWERLIEVSAWKVCPANYIALLGLRAKAIHTRKKYRN